MLHVGLAVAQERADKTQPVTKEERQAISSIPAGYENVSWGEKLSAVIGKIKGKLVFNDKKSLIISRDGELEYHYGFLYIDPAQTAPASERKKMEEKAASEGEAKDEGSLFFVALKFPYLQMELVRKKIEALYGPATGENLQKDQGAIAWNGNRTIIIMWVDRYENRPYCRRITYLDKEVRQKLSDYQYQVFNREEIAIIDKLTK